VDDALRVGVGQGRTGFGSETQGEVRRELTGGLEALREILAGDEFHDGDRVVIVDVFDVMDADDVRVFEEGHDAHLVDEFVEALFRAGVHRAQDLQCAHLVEERMAGTVNHAHAAAAEDGEDFVLPGDDRTGSVVEGFTVTRAVAGGIGVLRCAFGAGLHLGVSLARRPTGFVGSMKNTASLRSRLGLDETVGSTVCGRGPVPGTPG
jgi:hypothetical protein